MAKEKKTLNLNFGPQHPAAHGVLRLILQLDGEVKDDDKMEEDADLDESDGYTGKAGKGGTGYDAKVGGKGRTGYDAGSKALQERFQRLANIIK